MRRFVVSTGMVLASACNPTPLQTVPLVDYHLHFFSPGVVALTPRALLTGDDAVAMLDSAEVRYGLILSDAYMYGNPNRAAVADEYAHVRAENDWTAQQVALHPERLRAFCSFNPLKDYALAELERCAANPYLRSGIKLHFGNSDVDVHNPDHVARLRRVFHAANAHGMAIVVHERATVSQHRPYGSAETRAFLDDILPAAPDVPVQIAHLAGAGNFDDATDEALGVYVTAIAAGDPRVRHLYFDASLTLAQIPPDRAVRIVERIREVGLTRVLYGTDPAPGNVLAVRDHWEAFRRLPLREDELVVIARNVAPYMHW